MEDGLIELLKRTDQIRSLKLPSDRLTGGFSVPDDLLPNLEVFQGRADLIPTFYQGRPIRHLRAFFTDEARWLVTGDIPSLIGLGLVHLQHLSIDRASWKEDTMGYIAQHFPELVSLKVRAVHVNCALSTRFHMPRLRRATFLSVEGSWYEDDFCIGKRKSEADIIRECRGFWTRLEYLRLGPNYFWMYRCPEAGWIRVINVE